MTPEQQEEPELCARNAKGFIEARSRRDTGHQARLPGKGHEGQVTGGEGSLLPAHQGV